MNKDLVAIIRDAAAMGAAETLRRLRPADDRISQRQAVKEFGIGFMNANRNRISFTMNGNRKEYSRAELEQVKASMSVAALAMQIESHLIK